MTNERLYKILSEVTRLNPRGEKALRISADGPFERVNVHFCTVDVYLTLAQLYKDELEAFLMEHRKKFFAGPNHITFGAFIGDHSLAFQLLAVGKVLGFWDLITPPKFSTEHYLFMTDSQL